MAEARPVRTISAEEAMRALRRPRMPGHGLDETGRYLDIGRERIALSDVVAYSASGREDKDFTSNFATAAVFGAGAAAFTTAIVIFQWRNRFWAGSILFGLIALFALADIGRLRWHRSFTFELTLRDGSTRRFVTVDEAEADALGAALDVPEGSTRGGVGAPI